MNNHQRIITRPANARRPATGRSLVRREPVPGARSSDDVSTTDARSKWASWSELALRVKLLLGGLGLTAAGVAAYFSPFVDPVKQKMLHSVWKENPTIQLTCNPCEIAMGRSTEIAIDVSPNSMADVADGVVKVTFDPKQLTLSPETPISFETTPISSPQRLKRTFVFYPSPELSGPGASDVKITLETKFGRYDSKPVHIAVSSTQAAMSTPYIDPNGKHGINLSGEWRIELGGWLGGMSIKQNEHNDISGTYWLNDSKGRIQSDVDGYKDGTSFKVFFVRPKSASRWRVDANFRVNSSDRGFLEMNGCAFSIHPDGKVQSDSTNPVTGCAPRDYAGWRGDGGATFYATSQLQQ